MSSMTTRDRLILLGAVAVAVLVAAWLLAVSPARKQASKSSAEVASARSQLAQAQAEAAEARNAQQRYRSAYGSLTSLGMAVPTSQEVPSLMYTLDHAANRHKVDFTSIANGAASAQASSAPSASASGASAAGGPASAPAPFTQMPFTFVFGGDYQDLIKLLTNLESFTVQTAKGDLRVSGRLLTIQSIQLGAEGNSGAAASTSGSGAEQGKLVWTITASAYALAPVAESSPATTPGAAGAQPASAAPASPSGGAAPTATPAVIKVSG